MKATFYAAGLLDFISKVEVRGAHMPYVDLPGVHLWYNDTGGTGTPVVFMHAASGTCESQVYQLPVCTAAGYRCIPYDRRNWGRSRSDPTGSSLAPW